MNTNNDRCASAKQRFSDAAGAAAAKMGDASPSAAEMASKAKDTANTAIGFGLMGAAKIQRQAKAFFEKLPSESQTRVKDFALQADSRVEALISKVEEAVATAEGRLPERAAEVVRKARETGTEVRGKIRDKVIPSADSSEAAAPQEASEL